jgi:hypothetical protein
MMRLTDRLWNIALWFDQGANVLIGSGYCDEMLSAYAHRKRGWRRGLINGLFFWQDDHCLASYEHERARKQLPPEYRT